ncbi:hypothetical protein ACFL6W_10570 [Thermodesulfobacteriota bacterium]
MSTEKLIKWRPTMTAFVLLSLCTFLSSCASSNSNSGSNQANYPFSGDWQGNGTDSEGNKFTFAAKVSHLGNNKYRVMFLDKLDTLKKPTHILDGVLENNKFSYTADEGLYEGGGTLSKDLFEGYYKGSADGTYKMWRTNSEMESN